MADYSNFRKELEQLINKYSLESGSDTPDFILADYLVKCLRVFEVITRARERWYGKEEEENITTQGMTCNRCGSVMIKRTKISFGLDNIVDSLYNKEVTTAYKCRQCGMLFWINGDPEDKT